MTEDEKYVREHVVIDELFDLQCSRGGSWSFKEGHVLYGLGWFGWTDKEPNALGKLWSAAAKFTRTRLQQIRDVEEEIDWMQREIEASTCGPADEDDCGCVAIPKRILVARTAALADLKRGLRVAEERTER